jgi:hypothetical protein
MTATSGQYDKKRHVVEITFLKKSRYKENFVWDMLIIALRCPLN